MRLNQEQCAELDAIAAKAEDGKLHAKDVVLAARNPNSALHSRFEWDDAKAAESYRLEQARGTIEVYVTSLPGIGECRGYVSLPGDRRGDGGYTKTSDALGNTITRDVLVEQMRADLRQVLKRHSYLRSIAGDVFETIEQALEAKAVAA